MKKKFLFSLLLTLGLSLCACSSGKSGNVDDIKNTGNDLLTIEDNTLINEEPDSFIYDEDEEYTPIEHDEPFHPSSFDGFTYKSTLESLGKYEGLSYSLPGEYVPTDAEVEEEVQYLLEMYELEELNQENAEYMGYESVEDVYASTKASLSEDINAENVADAASALIDAVLNSSSFTLDESEVNTIYEEQLASYEEMGTYFGVTLEQLCTDYFEMTLEELQSELKNDAASSIKIALVVNAILKDAKIDMASIWDEKCNALITDYGYEDAWEYVDMYDDERYLIDEVKYKTVIDLLMEKGVNTAK